MVARREVVDLNADVGESFGRWQLGDDAALLPRLSSANVACGFHAGDPTTLRRTCALAVRHGVSVGAQVGYRDLAGFGRRFVDVPAEDLAADVLYQVAALHGIAAAAGGGVTYLKPHGALYHAVITNERQAAAVLDGTVAAQAVTGPLTVLGFPGSALLRIAADLGVPAVAEGFADRGYADGLLLPRSTPGALLTDPVLAGQQAVRLVRQEGVGSLCVHGDTPGAAMLAGAVRDALEGAGIAVASFAPARS